MREAAAYFQPGYSTLARDDASFYFLQNRALMIATGSWDSPSFRAQADFEIGVFSLPLPTPDHPRFGQHMLGRASEAETGTGLSFGIPKNTKNFSRALDFLQFLASRPGNATFSRVSGWLPSVVGVEPADYVQPFLPETDGYVDGFASNFPFGGNNASRVISSNNNILVGRTGSVQAFKDAIRQPLMEAIQQDLARYIHITSLNLNRQDAVVLAYEMLATHPDAPASVARKINEIRESQGKLEASTAWMQHELIRLAK
jgi:raffinose/stachyose/melibiose transport system substrate-binding protein